MNCVFRRAAAILIAAAVIVSIPVSPRAQAVPAIDTRITYILPQWVGFLTSSDSEFAAQVQNLRTRLGPDGPRVKLGFTTYITISMTAVDPTDLNSIDAALAPTWTQVDDAIARAEANGIPICLSFLTAIRGSTDPAQAQAMAEDRRDMQWYNDNSMASGWLTLSRYARKQELLQAAFIERVGEGLAARMLAHPDTLVAASGDGEVELAYQDLTQTNPPIADYSPFAIAEFRDWLRGTGLYAAGQPFAGEAYANSARYNADSSLATLDADFGTTFDTWNLKYFDWSLSDAVNPDPNAIPATAYNASGFNAFQVSYANGFDAPRTVDSSAWYALWNQFRQTMVWRHNREFAKWITTSPDPFTGATVPANRWFTDQIPGDYLFGSTPSNPNPRLVTSASPLWSADVTPYGSLGITAFGSNVGGTVFRTLPGAAPQIAARKVRWGIFEWNPSVPPIQDLSVYRDEMSLVSLYRPGVLSPYLWEDPYCNNGVDCYTIEDSYFQTALSEWIAANRIIPLTLSTSVVYATTTLDGSKHSPAQTVRVSGAPGETPAWSITPTSCVDAAPAADGRSFTVTPKVQSYAAGSTTCVITVSSSDPGYSSVTLTVSLTALASTQPPFGSFDSPTDGTQVTGEVAVTGWALDDVGVKQVDIYREAGSATNLAYIGTATLVAGARSDVTTAYSTRPLAQQAGWGYMLLTNFLPNGGEGTFYLHAIVTDVEGNAIDLGRKMILARNQSAATLPFGTIDTPAQGQTVSGTITNFGWALTPQPGIIPTDGSTIGVYIDNALVGHPTYNQFRSDIASLFPNYANTNGAVGYLTIDTSTLTNGVHTIYWVVTDTQGRAQGVGSRYFTVANP